MPEPYYADDLVTLHLGDCLDVMAAMPDASVDAVVTDPPYGLEFMSVGWDTFKEPKGSARTRNEWQDFGSREHPRTAAAAARVQRNKALAFQEFSAGWAAEAFRLLKPGGHLLAFGGTRTYHRLACAVEDAGFEIRDSLHWLYGSGFPKSLNAARAIDRAMAPGEISPPVSAEGTPWEGWGTALKPSHEPVIVARKPLAGTVAANVLEWGTGALNVDGCRVAGEKVHTTRNTALGVMNDDGWKPQPGVFESHDAGRWPPNLLLTHSADCNGTCAPGCPVGGLDGQSGALRARGNLNPSNAGIGMFHDRTITDDSGPGDTGGASRFFPVLNWDPEYDLPFLYCAKAPKSERPQAEGVSAHPTVKPLAVMRWLVRLVTPPGGTVLDPFAGTGTTGQACALEGFRCVLAERDPDSAELARVRLARPVQQQMTLDLPALPTTE